MEFENVRFKNITGIQHDGDLLPCAEHKELNCPGRDSEFHAEQERLDREHLAKAFREPYSQGTVRNYHKDRRLSGKARKKARRKYGSV